MARSSGVDACAICCGGSAQKLACCEAALSLLCPGHHLNLLLGGLVPGNLSLKLVQGRLLAGAIRSCSALALQELLLPDMQPSVQGTPMQQMVLQWPTGNKGVACKQADPSCCASHLIGKGMAQAHHQSRHSRSC